MTQDIRTKRARIRDTINWTQYRQERAALASQFPDAFMASGSRAKKPLALGIKHQLADAAPDGVDIEHFLRAYTFGPKYLRCLRVDAGRVGLDGQPAGTVSDGDAWYARTCLAVHLDGRHERREARLRAEAMMEAA